MNIYVYLRFFFEKYLFRKREIEKEVEKRDSCKLEKKIWYFHRLSGLASAGYIQNTGMHEDQCQLSFFFTIFLACLLQNGPTVLDGSLYFSTKLNMTTPCDTQSVSLVLSQINWSFTSIHKGIMNVYDSCSDNCQNLNAAKIPLSRWRNKPRCTDTLSYYKNQWAIKPWYHKLAS